MSPYNPNNYTSLRCTWAVGSGTEWTTTHHWTSEKCRSTLKAPFKSTTIVVVRLFASPYESDFHCSAAIARSRFVYKKIPCWATQQDHSNKTAPPRPRPPPPPSFLLSFLSSHIQFRHCTPYVTLGSLFGLVGNQLLRGTFNTYISRCRSLLLQKHLQQPTTYVYV